MLFKPRPGIFIKGPLTYEMPLLNLTSVPPNDRCISCHTFLRVIFPVRTVYIVLLCAKAIISFILKVAKPSKFEIEFRAIARLSCMPSPVRVNYTMLERPPVNWKPDLVNTNLQSETEMRNLQWPAIFMHINIKSLICVLWDYKLYTDPREAETENVFSSKGKPGLYIFSTVSHRTAWMRRMCCLAFCYVFVKCQNILVLLFLAIPKYLHSSSLSRKAYLL